MRRSILAWVGGGLLLGACFGGDGGPGSGGDIGAGDAGALTGGAGGTSGASGEGGSGGASGEGGASGGGSGSGEGGSGGASGEGGASGGGSGEGGASGGGGGIPLAPGDVERVDILLVVDNSGSMREEQEALRAELPTLIDALVAGGAQDVHLGVVSSDMGLVGIPGIPGCDGLGDDGIMNNVPTFTVGDCQATYPRFLTHVAGVNETATTASDLGCIATLGTEGCGFEQQLEAGLKALWPSVDVDPLTGQLHEPNRVTFLGDAMGFGQLGHGDLENAGFLRNDPVTGLSVLAVVIVTDEEDCSSRETMHFTPDVFLDPGIPEQAALAMQDLNLRCHFNEQNLYEVTRYAPTIEGEPFHPFPGALQSLRPGAEQLVIFGLVAGVPSDLVDPNVDLDDPAARDGYYDAMLEDPRMLATVNTSLPPGEGNLIPSCESDLDGDGSLESRAFPPRRMVEVARRFGNRGVVDSICDGVDLGPITAKISEVLADPSP